MIEAQIADIEEQINENRKLPKHTKDKYINELKAIDAQITTFYENLDNFVASNNPTDLLLKLILSKSPWGISPFFIQKPGMFRDTRECEL